MVTEDGYQIDETLTGVFAYPLLSAGPFLGASVESFGQLVGSAERVVKHAHHSSYGALCSPQLQSIPDAEQEKFPVEMSRT